MNKISNYFNQIGVKQKYLCWLAVIAVIIAGFTAFMAVNYSNQFNDLLAAIKGI